MPFPLKPTNGQVWTEYGRTWQYDGSGWGSIAPTVTAVSKLEVRTMAQLIDAASDINKNIRVLDAPGGEATVYSDGVNWLRVADQSPVK